MIIDGEGNMKGRIQFGTGQHAMSNAMEGQIQWSVKYNHPESQMLLEVLWGTEG
jgi:hypothetical protein